MKIYNYAIDGKYIGESDAMLDPLESKKQKKEVFIIPANATTVKPPKQKDGKDIVFNVNTATWAYVDTAKPTQEKEATEQEKLTLELLENESFLNATDYKVVKAAEEAIRTLFPFDEYVDKETRLKRQQARDRINEIRELLKSEASK